MPKNLKDIGIGLQKCVPNPIIIAVANRMAITPSWSEMNIYNRLGDTVVLIDRGPHFELILKPVRIFV